jgi:hypothetical protein
MPLDVSRAPASASPLWIIALFIALSEVTAGAAAITTNGSARLIFACFAVSFPTAVFATFVWLLTKHAPNLYAPGQYSKDITPEIYRTGIGISAAESLFFGRAVAEAVVPLLGQGTDGESRGDVVEQVARHFEAAVAESSVTVSLNRLKPGAELLQLPITEETTVDSLLDSIYFALAPAVKPFTYGQAWTLINDLGNEYTEMGTVWARSRNISRDARPITEAGIVPGQRLIAAVKGGGTERRRSPFTRRLASVVSDLRDELDNQGIPFEDVSGQQRPRLIVRLGGQAYGLYVMSGVPKENEDWVKLASAATAALESERGFPIVPVLALDQKPPGRVLKTADASRVAVLWLVQGVLHNAPWVAANAA